MRATKTFGIAIAAVAVALIGAGTAADAKRRPSYDRCKPYMTAAATGTGILGAGTAEARRGARFNFESMATDKYGDQYGNFDKAINKRWDCKKGAILLAKCVVTARPCHQ